MRRHTLGQRRAAAWLAAILAAVPAGSAISFESAASVSPGAAELEPGREAGSELKICAAFDLHHLTMIEDAGGAVGVDHERIAEAAGQIIAARRLCRAARFGDALEIYTRVAAEEPSARWLR